MPFGNKGTAAEACQHRSQILLCALSMLALHRSKWAVLLDELQIAKRTSRFPKGNNKMPHA